MLKFLASSLFIISITCPISGNCASIAIKDVGEARIADSCLAGAKTRLHLTLDQPLPAASFYRLELSCPQKPENALVKANMGYPESDIIFEKPGHYKCLVEAGILTKCTCASVKYRLLGQFDFSIYVSPNEEAENLSAFPPGSEPLQARE